VPSVSTGGVILYAVIFALLIFVPLWIGADATRRGDSGLAWGLLAL